MLWCYYLSRARLSFQTNADLPAGELMQFLSAAVVSSPHLEGYPSHLGGKYCYGNEGAWPWAIALRLTNSKRACEFDQCVAADEEEANQSPSSTANQHGKGVCPLLKAGVGYRSNSWAGQPMAVKFTTQHPMTADEPILARSRQLRPMRVGTKMAETSPQLQTAPPLWRTDTRNTQ